MSPLPAGSIKSALSTTISSCSGMYGEPSAFVLREQSVSCRMNSNASVGRPTTSRTFLSKSASTCFCRASAPPGPPPSVSARRVSSSASAPSFQLTHALRMACQPACLLPPPAPIKRIGPLTSYTITSSPGTAQRSHR